MAPVEGVEKSTDLCSHYPGDVPLPTLLTQLVECLVLTVPLPEAMGKRLKVRLEDGFQDHHYRPLDTLVRKAGFPYEPLLAIFFLDPHPLDRRRHIPIGAPPLMQLAQGLVQVLSLLRRRHLGHARGTALVGLVRGFPQELPINQVQPVVEPHGRIVLGRLCHALAFPGDGW
jgi:hypothetical protein